MKISYPHLFNLIIKYILPFVRTYLSERAFSDLLNLKNNKINKLEVETYMRCTLSETQTDIDKLVSKRQIHNI